MNNERHHKTRDEILYGEEITDRFNLKPALWSRTDNFFFDGAGVLVVPAPALVHAITAFNRNTTDGLYFMLWDAPAAADVSTLGAQFGKPLITVWLAKSGDPDSRFSRVYNEPIEFTRGIVAMSYHRIGQEPINLFPPEGCYVGELIYSKKG